MNGSRDVHFPQPTKQGPGSVGTPRPTQAWGRLQAAERPRVLLPSVRDPALHRSTKYPCNFHFVRLHLCLRLFPGGPKAGDGPRTHISTSCSPGGFLSSGPRIHNPGEPGGGFPASGEIHVGTSVFPSPAQPSPAQPSPRLFLFHFFISFFLRKQLCFRFYPQTFLKPLSKLAECEDT